MPVLVVLAVLRDEGPELVFGASLYGACLAAMILCSAIYNIFPHPDWEWLLKRLDHSAICLKIAGTVTSFALIAGQGIALAGVLWAAAALGVALKISAPFRFRGLSIALYLGMGWAVPLLGWGMLAEMPATALWLIAAGGLTYTAGTVFYLWERLPFHFTIWHIFVLAGSLLQYAALVVAVTTA